MIIITISENIRHHESGSEYNIAIVSDFNQIPHYDMTINKLDISMVNYPLTHSMT
jgi:hypothetical protein